jgi:hypothetical protein
LVVSSGAPTATIVLHPLPFPNRIDLPIEDPYDDVYSIAIVSTLAFSKM